MAGFGDIVSSILTLGIAMLIGFIAVKSGYIKTDARDAVSKILVRVTLPILVVTTMTRLEMDKEKLINCVTVLITAWMCIAVMFLLGILVSRLFRMKGERAALHACMSCFGNIVFIAYPLIRAIYGDEGILYAALFAFANDCYLWTVGVYKLSTVNKSGTGIKENIKKLVNPGTIAVLVSFAMMACHLRFGGILKTSLEGIAGTTTYLSMLFLGGTLADVDFGQIYKRVSLYAMLIIKMLLFPAALAAVLKLTGMNTTVAGVVVLQCAMPVSTVLTILASEYRCDVLYGAEGSFITTAACVVTLPAVYWMITQILGV
ncbi:MAG: AEC family transporter [Candidatus Ornithomonoglobus sp.]